jgi:hypothetical protein
MPLNAHFPADSEKVFHNTGEFAHVREFRISDGQGGFVKFATKCVWDKEEAKNKPIVLAQGVYIADVACHLIKNRLPRPPLAGEIIYSPSKEAWTIMEISDEESEWVLFLAANRSH